MGQRLQSGGEVRRLANHPALLRRPYADKIADHDDAAGDAEPHTQRLQRSEPGDCVDDGEPGADSPLGVIFVRLGLAEIDQHAVAHVLGDKAGEARDRVGDTTVIGADHLAQILGVETHR